MSKETVANELRLDGSDHAVWRNQHAAILFFKSKKCFLTDYVSDPARQLICRQKVFRFRSVASMEISEISSIVFIKKFKVELQLQLKPLNDIKLNTDRVVLFENWLKNFDSRKIDIVP